MGQPMLRRKWKWIGKIQSDEGFTVSYAHRGVRYSDDRGSVEVGYEDNCLFPDSGIWADTGKKLPSSDRDQILDRIQRALIWDGHSVKVWTSST